MATWDNANMLVNYIRHTFITCDDTGVCEAVLEQPEVSEKPGAIRLMTKDGANARATTSDEFDEDGGVLELAHSPDIHVDVGHRRRSETSKRLETLKQQRAAQSKITIIRWKSLDTPQDKTNAEASWPNLFEKKEITKTRKPVKSAVSEKLKACSAQPANVFAEYAKFDANVSLGQNGRLVRVFLTMLQDLVQRQKPLEVNVITTAKVSDLIGLICYRYTLLNHVPVLQNNINKFALYVAEDNGEIDVDLPPRSPSENVARFHFPFLALVERNSFGEFEAAHSSKKFNVNVRTATGQTLTFEFDSLDVSLQTLRDLTLEKRHAGQTIPSYRIMDYNLEKSSDPGVTLSLDLTIQSAGVLDFFLVRANSARVETTGSISQTDSATSPVRQSTVSQFYTVTMIQKFKREIIVQLSLCSDFIEIAPITERKQTGAGRFLNALQRSSSLRVAKTANLSLDRLGGSEVLEEKTGGKKVFRIVHRSSGGEWKSHLFESETNVAEQIVYNLNMYLDLKQSETRAEFLRRTPRKVSLFKRLQFSDLSISDSVGGGN